mmetsp:Transcript_15797/g.18235  ORF Transcript_15797/g.18235 Transcript_15797/m.18235 type:complete len:245 (-) Transcript_15797:158-892(-)
MIIIFLLHQLLSRVYFLIDFPITTTADNKETTHVALSKSEVVAIYHSRASIVQRMCHRHYATYLHEVIYAGVGLLCNNGNDTFLPRAMSTLPNDALIDIMHRLRLVDKDIDDNSVIQKENNSYRRRDYLMKVLIHYLTPPSYPLDQLKAFPLDPSEQILFDHSLIHPGNLLLGKTATTPPLSMPKLQTQFLSYLDYLLRNFELVRLESAYEIQINLVDSFDSPSKKNLTIPSSRQNSQAGREWH